MKKLIGISQVKNNMIIAQDIVDDHGILLIHAGNILTENITKKIKRLAHLREIWVYVDKVEVGVLVEKEDGKKVELKSREVNIDYSRSRKVIKKKLEQMEKAIEKTFAEFVIKPNDEKCQKEINQTVENIKNHIKVNSDLLQEIVEIKRTDDYLYNHSLNVAIISGLIGRWLNLKSSELDLLIKSGLLHDIGKLKIDPKILNKPGKLTSEEFEYIKKHPLYSYRLLSQSGERESKLLRAVTFHHEKQDGSGYPFGIKEDKIPVYARIVAIADIFDAMTSERVYRKRTSPFRVLEMFQNETFGKLDVRITMLFIAKFAEYYLGTHVILNTGEKAQIIGVNHYEANKPLIKLDTGEFVDISKLREVKIEDFVN